ncbi:MAG: CHASE3 domain-containing protein [Planctomycetia bacterium]|nr:CHASE3 domain-containing protein [Planctomycetia bacterium]
MAGQWTFGKRVGAGFALAGFVLLIIGITGYFTTYRLIENEKRVSHTHQVRRDLADLLSELKDAETGQRGFIITGQESFLEPYHSALQQLKNTLEHVRALTADNPDQQRRLDRLVPFIEAKLAELQRTIEQRRKEGFEATAKTVMGGEGKQAMDEARKLIGELDQQEQTLLAQRSAEAEAMAATTKAIILWGSSGGLVLVSLTGWWLIVSLRRQIGSAVQHIRSSSAELQAAATQMSTGAREQAAATTEVATTIKELVVTARQIAESAQRVAGMAEESARGARSGDQSMRQGLDAVANMKRQVDAIVRHMVELGRKSQQIGGVLDVINELAEQTNILSVNASIEAAGAGEHGRRFAVVADEIRKLADRVGRSTQEIKGLIDEVRSAVNTTVMVTETGSKAVDASARQFDEVSGVFQRIVQLVETTTEATREIELSTKQQTTAVNQVNESVASVAQVSKESEISTAQTLQTATELTTLSRNLERIVQPQATAWAAGSGRERQATRVRGSIPKWLALALTRHGKRQSDIPRRAFQLPSRFCHRISQNLIGGEF